MLDDRYPARYSDLPGLKPTCELRRLLPPVFWKEPLRGAGFWAERELRMI
jgi:hypothetical protein